MTSRHAWYRAWRRTWHRARRRAAPAIRLALVAGALGLVAPCSAQEIPALLRLDVELEGRSRAVDVYRPAGTPLGVAVIAHGFARSRVRHADLGRALAAYGVVAVIPDLPNVVNLWGNGDALVELVGKLERGEVAPVAGRRDGIVLVGTSAGGLATVLAAARLPGLAGWVGLDPVDRTGSGPAAAARVASPAVVMLAEPSLCNLVTSGEAIAQALPHRLRSLAVTGASHCDFEDPTNAMCEAACGRGSEDLRAIIRAEIVATVRELLAAASDGRAHARAASPIRKEAAP